MSNRIFLKHYDHTETYTDPVSGSEVTEYGWMIVKWRKSSWASFNTFAHRSNNFPEDPEFYPYAFDQRVHATTKNATVAWTNKGIGFEPQFQSVADAYNIIKAQSLQLELCTPTIIIPPTTDVATDGIVKVRGQGGFGTTLTYKLIYGGGGDSTNTTGVFIDVPVGTHSLQITETQSGSNPYGRQGYFANEIIVAAPRAFGVRYRGQFDNEMGREVTVEILRDGYTGSVEEICFGGIPLILTTDVIGDDFVTGLVPTEMRLDVLQEYDGQYDDLFITEQGMWNMKVTDSTYIDIEGVIFISQSNIEHQDNPIHVSIVAYAGLTDLGEKPLEGWNGNISLLDVIVAIQSNYNVMDYPIEEFTGMRETLDPTTYDEAMFSHYFVNASMFNEMTPKEAVSNLLESFGCSMSLSQDGFLRIQLIANYTLIGQSPSFWKVRYNNAGIYQTTHGESIGVINIRGDRTGDAFYIEGGQSYGYLQKVSKFSINTKIKELDNWEMPMDSTKWDVLVSSFDAGGTMGVGSDEYLVLAHSYTGAVYTHSERAKASYGSFRAYGLKVNFKASVEMLIQNPVTSGQEEDLIREYGGVCITIGDEHCMSDAEYFDNNIGYVEKLRYPTSESWESVELEGRNDPTGLVTGGLPMRMWIYGIWRQSYSATEGQTIWPTQQNFKNIHMYATLPVEHELLNEPYEVDLGWDGDDIGNIEMLIGDAPDEYYYSLNHAGVLARDNTLNTQNWETYIDSTSLPLREHMANNLLKLRGTDIKRLEGTLYVNYPEMGSVIYDNTVDGIFFMPQHFSYDVKFNKLEFSGLEVVSNSGNKLLEDTTPPDLRLLEDSEDKLLQ